MASAAGGAQGSVRRATHAGSWYSDDPKELSAQLSGWLSKASVTVKGTVRAIIAPHAGYSYSGPTAGYAYKHMAAAKESIKRVFVLGPSHHVYLDGCALPETSAANTPLGKLQVDADVVAALSATGKFEVMDRSVEEDEHSIEMHLPYIAQVMGDAKFTYVPILVGSTSGKAEERFGKLLAPYLDDPANFFVTSSDFCHWGSRFRFQHYDKSAGEIWQSIEALDHQGMALIEAQDRKAWRKYLASTENTICGRHPIGVLLETIAHSKSKACTVQFVRYAQSSQCKRASESSVSYASAVASLPASKAAKKTKS